MSTSETVRCSPWTQATNPDPCGTAGEYDTILAIEVPGPWPTDVGEISELWSGFDPSVRALAVLPTREVEGRSLRITAWRRASSGSFVGTDYALTPGASVAQAIASVVAGEDSDCVVATPAPTEILVCGHGQRDRCCGSLGVRLETQLAARLEGVRVRRCSHLGGHRFAPTAITLPDGRWWAYLDAEIVDRILANDVDAAMLASHYRGLGGLSAEAQVVERQLFAEHGPAWNDVSISNVTRVEDGDSVLVTVDWQNATTRKSTSARVSPAQPAPQVKCGSAGVITKIATEWRVDGLRTSEL